MCVLVTRPLRGLAVKRFVACRRPCLIDPRFSLTEASPGVWSMRGTDKSLISQCPGRPGLLTRVGGMPRKRYTARPRSGRVTSICARTRTCRLVGGTPRQPKSEHFHTKGLSAICHFLAPWKSPFLCVKCSGGRSRVFTREKARESSEPLFKG